MPASSLQSQAVVGQIIYQTFIASLIFLVGCTDVFFARKAAMGNLVSTRNETHTVATCYYQLAADDEVVEREVINDYGRPWE